MADIVNREEFLLLEKQKNSFLESNPKSARKL
jgi:hypothetical protein